MLSYSCETKTREYEIVVEMRMLAQVGAKEVAARSNAIVSQLTDVRITLFTKFGPAKLFPIIETEIKNINCKI